MGLFKPPASHVIGVNAFDILDALSLSLSHKAPFFLFPKQISLFLLSAVVLMDAVESVVVLSTYVLSVPCLDSIVRV